MYTDTLKISLSLNQWCGQRRKDRIGPLRRQLKARSVEPKQDVDFLVREIEIGEAKDNLIQSNGEGDIFRNGLREIQKLFVPQKAVTDDYLLYQLWTFPSHVFGWMSHSLAGSSMLKALGVGSGPADAVGLSAAIKWITKDGIGAAGRLFVGGKLGYMFDEDPKRWRMIAEIFTTTGLFLEIATQVSPNDFVILAGGGTIAKALGSGIGRPCFRVIQTHFAVENNIGDVSAKEEVWETSAQLVGIAASVALLSALETLGTPEAVVPAWFGVQAIHVAIRYYSLKVLCFPWPNFKRGSMISSAFIRTEEVPSVQNVSYQERMFQTPIRLINGTECIFGSRWSDAIGSRSKEEISAILRLYQEEKYILLIDTNSAIRVILWVDASGEDLMRALLQACWIDEHTTVEKGYTHFQEMELMTSSYSYINRVFPEFERKARDNGWDFEKTILPFHECNTRLEKVDGARIDDVEIVHSQNQF